MAQGIFLTTRDFGLGVQPPDPGNRIFVVGGTSGPFETGVAEPITSRLSADFRTHGGVNKATEACGFFTQNTGAAVTLIGFDAATTAATADFFETRRGGAIASTQLGVSFSAAVPDDLCICVEFIIGGAFGTAGITYRITKDGGQTWSEERAMGTALTIALAPYAQNLVFTTAETVLAGDSQVAVCYAKIGGTNAVAAVSAAVNSSEPGDAIYLCSNEADATVTSCYTLVLAGEAANKNRDLITETRDINHTGTESALTWAAAARAQALIGTSRIWCPMPGHYPTPGGFIDSGAPRRSAALHVAARYLLNAVQTDPARVTSGGSSILTPMVTLPAPTGANRVMRSPGATYDPEYLHNEETRPSFDTYGIGSFYIEDDGGVFSYNARLRSSPGSDFDLVQLSRIMHKARNRTAFNLRKYRHQEIFVGDDGFIRDSDANAIDADMNAFLADAMVSTGNCSDIQFFVSRTDNVLSTKTINAIIDITPPGWLKTIRVSIGFVNPAIRVAA